MTDAIWNWQGWHTIKWIFGSVLLSVLLVVIWKMNTAKNANEHINQEVIDGIKKLVFDTHLSDKQTINKIQ